MEQQYGDDFISITDEDGKEYELEVLAELEHEGSRYLARCRHSRLEAEYFSDSDTDSRRHLGNNDLVGIVQGLPDIIDIGPDGGTLGGEVVFTGTPRQMLEDAQTITARYLRKTM